MKCIHTRRAFPPVGENGCKSLKKNCRGTSSSSGLIEPSNSDARFRTSVMQVGLNRAGGALKRNFLSEAAFQKCRVRALRNGPTDELPNSGSASGRLTSDDGNTRAEQRHLRAFCFGPAADLHPSGIGHNRLATIDEAPPMSKLSVM